MHGDEVALFFYSDLFLRHPELREMFPVSMAAQRGHLVRAIARIASDVGRLDQLSALAPWLTATPCVSREPDYRGERGLLPDGVARSGSWSDRDAYIGGPTPMVEGMAARLASQGVPAEQIHIEDFGWSEP